MRRCGGRDVPCAWKNWWVERRGREVKDLPPRARRKALRGAEEEEDHHEDAKTQRGTKGGSDIWHLTVGPYRARCACNLNLTTKKNSFF